MAEEKSTVLGIRLDPEERKRFDEFVSEEGKNNKDFMCTLLNLYELNKGKVKNINLVGDIETLEGYTNKIHQTFINIIDKLESQKGDILEHSQKDLQIYKDKVNDLQINIDKIKLTNSANEEKVKGLTDDYVSVKMQNNQLQESLQDKLTIIEEYKSKNDTLTGILEEYKGYKAENEKLKQSLVNVQDNNDLLSGDIKDKSYTISGLNKDIDILKMDHIKVIEGLNSNHITELEQLKKENSFNINKLNADLKAKDDIIDSLKLKHAADLEKLEQNNQKELESLKKESELNIKLASAEIKEELNNKLNKEQLKHNADVEQYQAKYKSLLEEIDKMRTIPKTKKDNLTAKDNK